jgi:predicted alpha/beta hydrolase family esterase
MKQQVVVIHGGDAFETYEEYLRHLNTVEVNLETLLSRGWKGNLQKDLGEKFEVLQPRMPNPSNARYKEWKIWFEKIIPFLDDDVIFVGHSLGGIFLAKYLSENDYPKKIKAVFLIAAPYNTATEHPLVDFNIETSLKNLQRQAPKTFLYHSRDDEIVPFSNFEKYQKELPEATVRIFEDQGHFNDEELPELITDIQGLQS